MNRLWVLGSSGWMPSKGRETTCVLVEIGKTLIMLDAGTGVANLAQHTDVLARHERLNIILTHYHLDHTVGLMYLKRFCSDMEVDVFGPGAPHYPKSCRDYAQDLLQQAFYSSGPHGFARDVTFQDYGDNDFLVGGVCVHPTLQKHSAPSFRLRLNDLVVLATDTTFDASAWKEERTVKLLLHECWQREATDPRHSSAEALASGLPRNRFDHVLWLHQNPAWDATERMAIARTAASCSCTLASDDTAVNL